MSRRTLLLCPLAVAACSENVDLDTQLRAGAVYVCHGVPGWMDDNVRVWTSGTVGTAPAGVECSGKPAHGLRIDTMDGPVDFAYAIYDADDVDITPELDLQPGQALQVLAVHGVTWGTDTGFVVYDTGGIVAAFEPGYQGAEPVASDLEGLDIERGAPTEARREALCGMQRGNLLEVGGRTQLSLRNGEVGEVTTTSGHPVQVMNVANYEYERLDCTDTWGPKAWAVWR